MNVMIGHHTNSPAAPVSTGFRITEHDRLTIDNVPYRFMGRSGDLISLQREDGHRLIEQYKVENLARLSATGKIRHEVEYYLPDDLKTRPASMNTAFQVSRLTPAQQRRFHIRYAQVRALDDMVTEGLIRPATAEIEMVRDELEDRVQPYLAETATERDMLANHAAREGGATGKTAKTRGGKKKVSIELYSSDYLRKRYAAFRKGGVEALVDKLSKSNFVVARPIPVN